MHASSHESNLDITEVEPLGEARVFHITHPSGAVETTYRADWGMYCIANLDVAPDKRQQGIGKTLLRAALVHATGLEANGVYAGITSRECHDAMVSVFGAEAVTVQRLGGYAPEGQDKCVDDPTLAYLLVDLYVHEIPVQSADTRPITR